MRHLGWLICLTSALVPRALEAGLIDGTECTSSDECDSGYCYPGPPDECFRPRSYCIARDSNCAQPGTEGVMFGDLYPYDGRTYECKVGVGLAVASGELCATPTRPLRDAGRRPRLRVGLLLPGAPPRPASNRGASASTGTRTAPARTSPV